MVLVNPYLQQYQKNHVETATPEKILILLYDGAIQFLNKAKIAIAEGTTEQVHNNIISCENIILEFMGTLNMKEGGALSKNLYNLYEYLYNTLVTANFNKDIKKIDEVLGHLKGLRETWQKAIDIAGSERKKEEDQRKLNRDNSDSDDEEGDDEDGDWA